jgi:SagB-type dehydrogenase family enzyme
LFRSDHPVAWSFHRNTSRWLHNSLETVAATEAAPRPPKEFPDAPFTPLPAHHHTDLDRRLAGRASCRRFATEAVPLADLGDVLHAGYGVTGSAVLGPLEFLERPVPSGGALYPLELYCIVRAVSDLEPGIYHYAPVTDGLEQLRTVALPARFLTYLFMGQQLAADAAAIAVITAVPGRSLPKYGDRGFRYQLIEAGHVAQNLTLAAGDKHIGSCSLGGFFDDELAALLTVDTDYEVALYALALGYPAVRDRQQQRAFDAAN